MPAASCAGAAGQADARTVMAVFVSLMRCGHGARPRPEQAGCPTDAARAGWCDHAIRDFFFRQNRFIPRPCHPPRGDLARCRLREQVRRAPLLPQQMPANNLALTRCKLRAALSRLCCETVEPKLSPASPICCHDGATMGLGAAGVTGSDRGGGRFIARPMVAQSAVFR
jgi:hypothetical protein